MGLGIIRASTPEEAVAVVKKYKDNGFVGVCEATATVNVIVHFAPVVAVVFVIFICSGQSTQV